MVFINLYWKDGRSGGFCKYKSSSLYNEAVEVIYTVVCQEAAMMPDVAWGTSFRIAQASEKVSNRKYLSTKGCPDYDN